MAPTNLLTIVVTGNDIHSPRVLGKLGNRDKVKCVAESRN